MMNKKQRDRNFKFTNENGHTIQYSGFSLNEAKELFEIQKSQIPNKNKFKKEPTIKDDSK